MAGILTAEWTYYWIALLSVVGLGAMGLDKLLAQNKRGRLSETSLWLVALLGGFVGVILGGILFHHKTSKARFWVPVGIALASWIGVMGLPS